MRVTLAEFVRGTQGALVGGRLDTVVTGVTLWANQSDVGQRRDRATALFRDVGGGGIDGLSATGSEAPGGLGSAGLRVTAWRAQSALSLASAPVRHCS